MVERYRSKRKISFIWLTLCIWLCLSGMTAYAECLVQDDAQLFSDSEVQQIETLAKEIETSWQMNVLVMTCDDADGRESNEVLEDTYEEYGLESNDAKGGIALIIDMDNRELNLVTERDMIYYITDYREDSIYDVAQKYASDGEYGEAMTAMLEKTLEYMKSGIPENQYSYDTETGEITYYHSLTGEDVLMAFLGALLAAALVTAILYRSYKIVKKYRYSTEQNARLTITAQNDHFVRQFETHRKIENETSGGGGDSGRTSTHSSSGGHTYGGGSGRGF